MRFYREKILLSLLEMLPEAIASVTLQKLMFLLCDHMDTKIYDFMPYKYGCYSMQLSNDVRRLAEEGYLVIDNSKNEGKLIRLSLSDFGIRHLIKPEDYAEILKIARKFADKSTIELIRYTYLNYPFFAINSIIAEQYLTQEEMANIQKLKNLENERILFTIGYEGRSLEGYMVKLIKNGVKVLCDVRKNAYSQKFGFSKSTLQKACEGAGIDYIHIPELGIVSEKRKELNTQADYERLFKEYSDTVLLNERDALNRIFILLQKQGQVAITCFERNPMQCHRLKVAEKLMSTPKCNYKLINL